MKNFISYREKFIGKLPVASRGRRAAGIHNGSRLPEEIRAEQRWSNDGQRLQNPGFFISSFMVAIW